MEELGIRWTVEGWAAFKQSVASADRELRKVKAAIGDVEKSSTGATQALDGAGRSAQRSGQKAKAAKGNWKAFAKDLFQIRDAADFARGAIVGLIGGGVIGVMTVAIRRVKDVIAGSIEVAKDFEASLMDLEVQASAANREFGDTTGTLEGWRKTVARMSDQLRVFTDRDVNRATARVIQMTKRLGLSEDQMETLISRTGELAAVKGMTLTQAVERTSSAMRGEAESSEYLGLTLNENYIASLALSLGFEKLWKDMTDAEKAQVRFAAFLLQTEENVGDAADTVDTLMGAQGQLNKEWERTQVSLGEIFIPLLRDATIALADYLEVARGARAAPRVMAGLSPQARGESLEEFAARQRVTPGVGPTMPGVGRMFPRLPIRPGDAPGRIMVRGGAEPGFEQSFEDYLAGESELTDKLVTLWQARADLNEQYVRDRIDARRSALESIADIEEQYGERIAQSNADFWRGQGDREEDAQLSGSQRRERFKLDWGQRAEDLERKIGVKIAAAGGEAWAEEDKNWWIQQQMIDFEREERQADEKLTLAEGQAAEKADLEATQAEEAHGIQMGRMEQQKQDRIDAVAVELEEKLTAIDDGYTDQIATIQEKEAEITQDLIDEYGDREDDYDTHLGHIRSSLLDHLAKITAIYANFDWPSPPDIDPITQTITQPGGGYGGIGPGGQYGMDRVVGRPTWIHVGEAGTEHVRVTPMGSVHQGDKNYYDQRTVNFGNVNMAGGSGGEAASSIIWDALGFNVRFLQDYGGD